MNTNSTLRHRPRIWLRRPPPLWRRIGVEGSWVALGQLFAVSGAVVGVRWLTHLLTPQAYGELALGMTVGMLAQQLMFVPLAGAFLRLFAPAQEANQAAAFQRGTLILLMQASVVWILFAVTVVIWLYLTGKTRWAAITVPASGFALLSGYAVALGAVQNAARHRIAVAWQQGAGEWLRIGLAVALVRALGMTPPIALWGYLLGAVVLLTSQLAIFHRASVFGGDPLVERADDDAVRIYLKRMRSYAWPYATWGLFTLLQQASERWALQTFRGAHDVGLYVVVYQCGYVPITLLTALLVQLLTPVVFSRAGDGSDRQRVRQAGRLTSILLVVVLIATAAATLVALLLHRQVFALFLGPEYRGVSGLVPWMALAGGLFAAGQVAALPIMAEISTSRLLAPKILTAMAGLALNVLGAKALGITGVVFASVLFGTFYLAWMLVLSRREVPSSRSGAATASYFS